MMLSIFTLETPIFRARVVSRVRVTIVVLKCESILFLAPLMGRRWCALF